MDRQENVTQLLEALTDGDQAALDELLPIVYDTLRRMARRELQGERRGHTLNTTALVHEAYLELVKLDQIEWQDRAHFFAVSAKAMRHILVDYAVKRNAQKRGGNRRRVPLDDVNLVTRQRAEELLALDEALKRLEAIDERQGRVVECRFFGGLTIEETAAVLGISEATVSRDWTRARAWLNRELGEARINAET